MSDVKFAILCTTIEVIACITGAIIFAVIGNGWWWVFVFLCFCAGFTKTLESSK